MFGIMESLRGLHLCGDLSFQSVFLFFCMEFHIFALKIRTPKVGAAAYEAKAVFQK